MKITSDLKRYILRNHLSHWRFACCGVLARSLILFWLGIAAAGLMTLTGLAARSGMIAAALPALPCPLVPLIAAAAAECTQHVAAVVAGRWSGTVRSCILVQSYRYNRDHALIYAALLSNL